MAFLFKAFDLYSFIHSLFLGGGHCSFFWLICKSSWFFRANVPSCALDAAVVSLISLQPMDTFHLYVIQAAHLFLHASNSSLFPGRLSRCWRYRTIKVTASTYMTLQARCCYTGFTGITWFNLNSPVFRWGQPRQREVQVTNQWVLVESGWQVGSTWLIVFSVLPAPISDLNLWGMYIVYSTL